MTALRVTLLGGFEVRLGSGVAVRLPTRKAQALLAYLAARPGRSHPRDMLASLLWGEASEGHARGGLRHALVALRRALAGPGASALLVQGQMLGLDADRVDVDVATFERSVAEDTPEALEKAAELYHGDLLLGFSVNEPLFEDWLVGERERLREMALEALARLLAHQTSAASTERAIQTAVRLLALDPLQEPVHRTLMRLYARQGRRGAALKQYQACVGALKRELGTEPEAETRTLYQELIRRPAASMTTASRDNPARPRHAFEPAAPDLPAEETALFGRQPELESLRRLLREAMAGHGRVATLVGEAGIGKTRVVSALAAEALSLGCRVLIGRCHESDSILPFGPWVDICRTGQLIADEEILGALHPARRAELSRLLPEASTAGLPPASDSALPLFESLCQLVEQVAAHQPLVLVLEDLHWADDMSLRLLAFVSRRIPAWTTLVVTTVREEELSEASMARRTLEELSRGARSTALVLTPLSRADTAQLVAALTRIGTDAPTAARLEEHVWAMSEGNPFIAVEVTRALDQENAIALPTRVRDLVARRLDRLSTRGQQLVAVAAVIGRRFDFPLVRAASGMEEHDAAEAVEEAVRLRVLQSVGDDLDFAHDRIRDVAYARLLPLRRRLLHRAVVEALEALRREQRGEQIEQLAHHALRGELPEKAVHYLRQAGSRAVVRSALQDARIWLEQALATLETAPESPSTLEQGFAIRLELVSVLMHLAEAGRALERLREAETLAEQLHDDGRRGRALAMRSVIHSLVASLDAALVTGTGSLEIARRLGDLKLRITATTYLELAHYCRGEYERVVELATDNLAALPDGWKHERLGLSLPPSIVNRAWLLLGLAELGRFGEAVDHAAEAIRLADPTQHAFTIGWAHCTSGTLHLLRGSWIDARARMEQGIAALRSGNVIFELSTTIATSAWVLAELGAASEAQDRIREGEQIGEYLGARGLVGFFGWIYVALAHACLPLGRLDDAQRFGVRALESSPCHPGYAVRAHHVLGTIAVHPDRFDAAAGEAHFRTALGAAEHLGMRPMAAHCHVGLATCYRRAGKAHQAKEQRTAATALYREMGMAGWLEKAEREAETS